MDLARQCLAVLIAACFLSQQVQAGTPPTLPTGGTYAAGSGSIKNSSNAVTINQATLRGIIDWNTFSIGQGGTVTFKNGSGATLNRVNGGQMSSILGSLFATGSVYVVNPEGVLIGPGAHVNTGGDFAASTLELSNALFLKGGSLDFKGDSQNVVVNLGDIFSRNGSIFLIGHGVTNSGSLAAANGTVGLAAGSEVLMKDSTGDQRVFVLGTGGDVTNKGTIAAAQAELKAKGGNIYALAGNNRGRIAANGTATINGQAWLVSNGGTTTVTGSVYAKNSVETSGEHLNIDSATVKTAQGGNWLLDPVDLTVDSGAASTIQNSLATTNVSVSTSATGSSGAGTAAPGSGDINVVANSIAWSSGNSLTLSAYRSINVNNGVTISNTGTGNVTLRADNTAIGVGAVAINGLLDWSASTGSVSLFYDPPGSGASKYSTPVTYSGSQVKTNSLWSAPANLSLSSQFTPYMLVNNATDLQNIGAGSGKYALGTNIDASSITTPFIPISLGSGGVFDGQGETISNLTINNTLSTAAAGLFTNSTGIIRNVKVTNENVTSGLSAAAGGLVGVNSGTIVNSSTSGTVSAIIGGGAVGGLVGTNQFGTIQNSSSSASVSTPANVQSSSLGGLVGFNLSSINGSYATGTVTGGSYSWAGGLVGRQGGALIFFGASIVNSYATGAVSGGSGSTVGGLLGLNNAGQDLEECPPFCSQPGYVGTSYATGTVTGTNSTLGGLIGNNLGTAASSYWDTTASGILSGAGSGSNTGITGWTTTQLQTGSVPTGFSPSVWTAASGQYPRLAWQIPPGLLVSGDVFNGATPLGGLTVDGLANGTLFGTATTNSNGLYTLTAPTGTTGVLTYLIGGGSTGNTFSDGKGTGDFTGMDIYTGTLRLLNSTNTTYSGLIAALNSALGSNSGANFLFSGQGSGFGLASSANLSLNSYASALTIDQPITATGTVLVNSTGNLSLASTGTISAAGSGAPLTLVDGGAFSNGAGANALSVSGGGRWLVYSQTPVNDSRGGLAYGFKQYNAAYGSSTPGQSTGNGFLYTLAPPVTASLTGTASRVYDSTATAMLSAGNYQVTGAVDGDTITLNDPASGTYTDSPNAGTLKPVAVTGLTVASASNGSANVYGYQLGSPSASGNIGTITKALLTDTFVANNKVYNGNTLATATLGTLTGLKGEDSLSLTGTAAYSFVGNNAGNVGNNKTVTETGLSLNSGNYTLSSVTEVGTANITPATLTATVAAINKTYDSTAAATGSITLHGIIGEDSVSLSNAMLAFNNQNVGTNKTVTESGTALTNSNYVLGAVTSGTANITPATLTATISANSKIYDSTTAATGSIALNGGLQGDNVALGSATLFFTNQNAGIGKTVVESGAVLTNNANGNYVLGPVTNGTANITPYSLTQLFTPNNKVYDGTTTATGTLGALSAVFGSDAASVAGTPSYSFANKNAGTGKTVSVTGLGLTGAAYGNYVLATSQSGDTTITPVTLTASIAANNKTYNGSTAAAGTINLSGIIGEDSVTVSNAALSFNDKNVANQKPVTETGAALSGADAANYTLPSVANGMANITPATLTATVAANNKTYDGTTGALGVVNLHGVIGSDTVSVGNAALSFTDKSVANGKPVTETGGTLSGIDAGNYTLAGVSNGTANITPATLTGTLATNNKTYDGTTGATGVVNLSGVIGNDSVSVANAALSFNDKNVANGKPVTETGGTLSGADAANYSLNLVTGTANITPATLTANYTADNKVYNGTTTATATQGSLTGIVGSDDVSLQSGMYNFSDKNAGTNKAVLESGAVLNGSTAGNYTLTLVQNGTASITPAELQYAATTGNTRLFGATNPAFTGTVTGLISGETLASVASGTPLFTSPATPVSAVGAYAVNGSGLTLTSANYTLSQASANANALAINPITIGIGSVYRYSGVPNPTFTVNYSGPSSDALKTALANLTLVTNAPANDAPGTYQITALVPAALAGSIQVQPGTLIITSGASLNNSATATTAQSIATFPAALETQVPPPPAPLPSAAGAIVNPALPANSTGQFQVVIAPSPSWTAATPQVGVSAGGDVLSNASFTETSPDGKTKSNRSTYAAGAQK